jgi:hypothetical protein
VFQSLAAALSLRFVLYWRTTPCRQISLDTLTNPTKKETFLFFKLRNLSCVLVAVALSVEYWFCQSTDDGNGQIWKVTGNQSRSLSCLSKVFRKIVQLLRGYDWMGQGSTGTNNSLV